MIKVGDWVENIENGLKAIVTDEWHGYFELNGHKGILYAPKMLKEVPQPTEEIDAEGSIVIINDRDSRKIADLIIEILKINNSDVIARSLGEISNLVLTEADKSRLLDFSFNLLETQLLNAVLKSREDCTINVQECNDFVEEHGILPCVYYKNCMNCPWSEEDV